MRTYAPYALLTVGGLLGCPAASDSGQHPAETRQAQAPTGSAQSRPAASQPASAPSTPVSSTDPIVGLLKLAEGIPADSIKPTDVLFIMARESQGDSKAGRLVAVQRHGKVEFPMRYELSAKDAMVPGVPFKGPFIVYARLDRDGDPMTKGQGDLYGAITRPLKGGEQDAHIVLKLRAASQPASQ